MDWEPYGVGFLFGVVIPLVITFAVFFGLMRELPHARPVACARPPSARASGRSGSRSIQAGLSWYLSGPANFSAIYGSASAIFAFLLSIYLGASSFVVAAVLTSVLDERARVRAVREPRATCTAWPLMRGSGRPASRTAPRNSGLVEKPRNASSVGHVS